MTGWLLWLLSTAIGAADTIKIGYINGLSGVFGLTGEEQLKAFYAAADMVNARGGVLGGRKIEIVPFDNKANPQETLNVLKQAIDQDIHYVASTLSSASLAISEALVKHNARSPDQRVLFLDFNALDPTLTESKCNFWHFRFEAHADMLVSVLTDYMARQPAMRKVYLVNQDYAYGQAVSRAAKSMLAAKRLDIRIVGDDLVPLGKVKDFAPYIAKIRASGADSILTGNWGNDLSLLIKAGTETGLKLPYYTLLAGLVGTPAAIGPAGSGLVKTVSSWHINAADATWEKTLLEFRTKYKSTSNIDYLPAIRTVEMLAKAIEKTGSADPVKVAYALEGMEYIGPSGRSWMRYDDHQLIAPVYVLRFTKAGQADARHDVDGTGYGWKTEAMVEAKDMAPPLRCQMERPSK